MNVEKEHKKIVSLSITIAIFLLLIFGAAYAIINQSISYNTENVTATLGTRPVFTSTATNSILMSDIPYIATTSSNEYEIANASDTLSLSLSTNYSTNTTCTYDVIWEWNTTDSGYTKTSGATKEFTVSGSSNDSQSFSEVQLSNYNANSLRTVLKSGATITAVGSTITTQTWTVTAHFYKTQAIQSNHKGKSYPGKVLIDNVVCSNTGGGTQSNSSATITSVTFYTAAFTTGSSCITNVAFNENVSVANYYININNNGYNEIGISNDSCYSNYLPEQYGCYERSYNYNLYAVLTNGETTAVYSNSYTVPTCFKGETKVLTSNGYVSIKDVKISDEVYSYNEETKQVELNKVTELYVHNDNHIYIIKVGNETIKVTKDHRMYVKDKYGKDYQWKRVEDIKQGDYLYTIDSREVPIYSITYKSENNKVYNIEVENNHTYYVTKSNYLVHNAKSPQAFCD